MNSRATRPHRFLLALATTMTLTTALAAEPPTAVSPGSTAMAATLGSSCPTFSWSGVRDATGYELTLYREGDQGGLELVLQRRVPGDARSWTPLASACPAAGFRYAWTVRAWTEEGAGAWSEPLLFATPGTPTEDEVREAVATLRRYQGAEARFEAANPAGAPDGQAEGEHPEATHEPRPRSAADTESTVRERVAPLPSHAGPETDPLRSGTVGNEPSPADIAAPGEYSLVLEKDLDLGGAIFREGYPFLHNDGGPAFGNVALGLLAMVSLTPGYPDASSGNENTALGGRALRDTTSGSQNTAVGFDALRDNSAGNVNTAVGSRALRNNTFGFSNTAIGDRAARSNSTGHYNTAVGRAALYSNTSGGHNTAVGYRALVQSDYSIFNTAIGSLALTTNTTGDNNTAVGYEALKYNTTGDDNTAIGSGALGALTTGYKNVAVGEGAMQLLTTGGDNVAIGESAGAAWTSGSNNIAIGQNATGSSADDRVIRIGNPSLVSTTFIGGIFDNTVTGGLQVFINGSSQLGTSTSSARFKRDVLDLEGDDERLLSLRPVSFRYKDDVVDVEGDKPLEYGLIAEEVAEIFPELVIYDDEGEPYTVRYHLLAPLLLAEIQRQERSLRDGAEEVVRLREELADLRRRLQALTDGRSGARAGPI